MFDPVHNGHLDAARFVLGKLALDSLKMIPCATPNHRDAARVQAQHRLQMLRLALADEEKIEADDIELTRTGVSYSVDTLQELTDRGISKQLVFVLGLDAFNAITQWHEWQKMFALSHLCVLGRPGTLLDEEALAPVGLEQRLVSSADELFASSAGKVLLLEEFQYDASSSGVRRALRMEEDVSSLLPTKVQLYIDDNRLYR